MTSYQMTSGKGMSDSGKHRKSGFTLLEVMFALAIGAAILMWGMPSLITSIRNNDVASQSVSLLAMLNFTKSESIRRNTGVDMVITMNADGWDAVVEDPNNETEVVGCVLGQLRCTSQTGALLTIPSAAPPAESLTKSGSTESGATPGGQTFTLTFNNRGYIRGSDDVWTPETMFLQHEHCSGTNQRVRIDITPTGQISSCTLACNSTAACP